MTPDETRQRAVETAKVPAVLKGNRLGWMSIGKHIGRAIHRRHKPIAWRPLPAGLGGGA